MDSKDNEVLELDQEALKNYQESRKRQRSASPSSDTDPLRIKKEKISESSPWKPDKDSIWLDDPSGLYGLKPEYLRLLGIEPPICNWVCVENFRCDKSELREVLELAGYVVVCSMIFNRQKHAKVMYSHPLEAVQAVSMLNKQMFYGRALTVTMMRYPLDNIILPKALPTVGPGFGTYGKPLRDIVKHYERFVKKEPHSLNSLLFYDPNNPQDVQEIRAPDGAETVEKSKDEIYERYQFSKQFVIRHMEDDSDDSRSEKDSKDCSWGTDNQKDGLKTAPPKYSPRSPTLSPPGEGDDAKNVTRSAEVPKIMKTTFSSNKTGSGATYSWDKTSTNQSGPPMSPGGPVGSKGSVSVQYNNRVPTHVGQRPMVGPNVAPGPVGPRFGFNPAIPVAPGFRPNVPMSGPTVPAVLGQQPMPNAMANPGYRTNVPMAGPNGLGIRANVPMVAGPNGPGIRANVPMPAVPSPPGIRAHVPMPGHNMVPGQVTSELRPSAGLPLAPVQTSFAVQFRNLPPTTTFAILSEKMSQCGQVLSVQLTTPGCATVSFSHPTHAQMCFRSISIALAHSKVCPIDAMSRVLPRTVFEERFNNLCVDGCVIQARMV